ncbi:NUDIX domain-containing protein [Sagittula salina]|uniref:NUDIX domain-containing protein n=1 Tax=Sagittula salina TaxID=2820268 RepID=A0A940MT68_9RHOB|nr:NUDIX domain-containing protein [Sagittula salina]MBP0484396.1 NUDIX domain-containing protein [Sagittula salina]
MNEPFRGAKLMLFAGRQLLVLRRDRIAEIDWPGYLDFPGGLREPGETPEVCVLRETREELGLALEPAGLTVAHRREGPKGIEWFFALHGPARLAEAVVMGDEGESWLAMPPNDFVAAEDAIPHFRRILRDYLFGLGVAG